MPDLTADLTAASTSESLPAALPLSLAEVLADLKGFGIEEFEEILTLTVAGKNLQIKISNVPTEDDLLSMLAVEGMKDYQFFQEVKLELLSRSITWINGVDLRGLQGIARLVVDPKDGIAKDVQVVLRGLILAWGLEIMQVLWKLLMVHSQKIENRLFESFPEAAVLTDVERRYRDRIEKEMEQATRSAITEKVDELLAIDVEEDEPSAS